MKNKGLIIGVVIIVLFVLIFTYIENKNKYMLTLELSSNEIKVNLYDEINLINYIKTARDSKNKNIIDTVVITVDDDKEDIFENNILKVEGLGVKVVNYNLESNGKVISKQLIIKVITDSNDPDFKPNYETIENESEINLEDEPSYGGDSNLTDEQINYLNKFR